MTRFKLPIYATRSCEVTELRPQGVIVFSYPNGTTALYHAVEDIQVTVGQKVFAGDVIGYFFADGDPCDGRWWSAQGEVS